MPRAPVPSQRTVWLQLEVLLRTPPLQMTWQPWVQADSVVMGQLVGFSRAMKGLAEVSLSLHHVRWEQTLPLLSALVWLWGRPGWLFCWERNLSLWPSKMCLGCPGLPVLDPERSSAGGFKRWRAFYSTLGHLEAPDSRPWPTLLHGGEVSSAGRASCYWHYYLVLCPLPSWAW